MFRMLLCVFAAAAGFCHGAVPAVSEKAPLPAVIGPYLQNPAADGMTVCFLAQKNEGGVRVLWRRGDDAGKQAETAAAGAAVPGTPWTVWKARLTPLQPGAVYEYQVQHGRGEAAESTPAHRFRTPDPLAKTFRAAFFNDVHNREATLTALMKHVRPEDYEMAFLVGDMWTDPSPAKGADQVFRSLEAYVRLLHAAEKPMLVIRGNHETRGGFAKSMAFLFDIPGLDAAAGEFDQQWQFALRAGPAWFLALDGGDDFTKRFDKFQPLRQRQAEWAKALLARKEGAGCWRVLLTHMPLYNNNIWNSEPCRQAWEAALAGAGFDLEFSGHDHCPCKLLPKGKTCVIRREKQELDKKDPQARTEWSYTTPWPVLIGGGPALKGGEEGVVKLLEVSGPALSVRCFGVQSDKPRLEFSIDAKTGLKTPAP